MKSVYFKKLHNEQEYYCPTTYRAKAAVVSTITGSIVNTANIINYNLKVDWNLQTTGVKAKLKFKLDHDSSIIKSSSNNFSSAFLKREQGKYACSFAEIL